MQRIVAGLLFAVFLLSPIAPAFAAVQPPQPMACHRPALTTSPAEPASAPASAAMEHCHGMGNDPAHASTARPASTSEHTLARGCCADHDCCRRQDRSQAIHLSSAVPLCCLDAANANVTLPTQSVRSTNASDAHSGRAPPAL